MKKVTVSIAVVVSLLIPLSLDSSALQNGYDLFQKALAKERGEGNLEEAISLYQKVIAETKDESLAAKAQLRIGICYEKLGQKKAKLAQNAFQKVIDNYPGQTETVKVAKEKLSNLLRTQAVVKKGDKEFRIHRISKGPDVYFWGAVSPDANYISYTDSKTYDLAVWELPTGKRRRLTTNPNLSGYAGSSIFSPDGKQIAFVWTVWETELRIIGLDGSNPRTLIRYKSHYSLETQLAGWSPDGNHILALVPGVEKTNKIVLVSVSDGKMRTLKTLEGRYPEKMSFSPDGRYIAYDFPQGDDSEDRDIFLLATDRSRETRLIDHPANDYVLGWTPDGQRLLFASNRTGSVGAWIIQVVDGQPVGQPELVKQDMGPIRSLGFTSQGFLFYGLNTGMTKVYLANVDSATYKVTSKPTPLSQQLVVENNFPEWSPDGKFLAYRSERISGFSGPRSNIISIRSFDTGEERELSPAMRRFHLIKWSPDGRSFLLGGYDNKNRFGLHVVDAQSGKVTATVLDGYPGSWSPDGKTIYYAKNDASTRSRPLVARDLESGEDKVLFRGHVGLGVAVSPDGEKIAYSNFSGEQYELAILYVLSLKDGKPQEILRLKNPEDFGLIAWSPDGSRILFVRRNFQENKAKADGWQIPVEGGQPQSLGLPTTDRLRSISIHPDGSRIAFSSGRYEAEIWVMENFLPEEKTEKKSK